MDLDWWFSKIKEFDLTWNFNLQKIKEMVNEPISNPWLFVVWLKKKPINFLENFKISQTKIILWKYPILTRLRSPKPWFKNLGNMKTPT